MKQIPALMLLIPMALAAQPAPEFRGGPALDAAIEQAIQDKQIPGAVLLIGRDGRVLYRKAYGQRSLVPHTEPMTVDTIFDAASLTKVVATTSSMMKLFENGKYRLNDKVTQYLPAFQGGKSDITIRNLLTHFSGLRPDLDLQPPWSGYETGVRLAFIDKPTTAPGTRFVYSDINFILLGELVRKLSGKPLPDYAHEQIFGPLGMVDTMYQPPASLRPRIAPTELVGGVPLRGIVHDETTRYMGGVAGHAGLFTTADDLSRFAQMLLGGGALGDTRVLSPLTVRKFTSPETPADQPILRGLGWDIDSPFSGNRGELYPIGSFGHTGFTGTSLWIDPATRSYVILLTNAVHPVRKAAITALRGKVATITAAALGVDAPGMLLSGYNETITGAGIHRTVARNASVETGLDVLAGQKFASLSGKSVGLITNHTGIDQAGRRNLDLMVAAGVNVRAVFSPEHGFQGKADQENVPNTKDDKTGVPVYSLYAGKTRRLTPEMLRGLDVVVFDIQDVGARFYTYSCTLAYALEDVARAGKSFVVLDRPNPITGTRAEGPVLDADLRSFIGCLDIPVRHGMTLGELARFHQGEAKLDVKLEVIRNKGWQRGDWFDSTGLVWKDPSPNMRSLNAAILYPGLALLEASKTYSVGRGTDAPFEQIGAEWIDGRKLAAYLNSRYVPGVRVYPTQFTPAEGAKLAGKELSGVRFVLTDRESFDSTRLGIEVAAALVKLFPGKLDLDSNARLIGNHATLEAIAAGEDPRAIVQKIQDRVAAFVALRQKYLLY